MSEGENRPMGRYTRADDQQEAPELHEVRLTGLPVRLYLQSRERHDELMREFSLLALSDEPRRAELPARFLELIEVLGVQYGGASPRPDAVLEQALEQGLDTIDLTYTVPASVVDATEELEHWLALADEFCAAERLLTLPRGPQLRQLAEWYFGEFRRQVAGAAPRPWDGPLAA